MRLFLLLFLLLQIGCATKYIIPGNRFMTPESQGGMFRSSAEFFQTSGNQLTVDVSNNSVVDGVTTKQVTRSGLFLNTSLMEEIDLFWTHTTSANSLFGAKYQFMGASRNGKGTGHKMAITAAMGGNEHETDGSDKVEFFLKGKEFQYLYGYRFSEMILAYSNLSYSSYSFEGKINSNNSAIDGDKPSYQTRMLAVYGGLEFGVSAFFGKVECGYQQLKTNRSKDESHFLYGYSIGVTW